MTTFPGCRSCTDPPPDPPSPEEAASRDNRLVRATAEGSTEALAELFSRHAGSVFAYLINRGFSTDTAEEAVQEAFLSAWKGSSSFHEGNVPGWLMRIAHRRALDLMREQGRRVALDARLQAAPATVAVPSAEDCLLASSLRYAAVAAALAGLPPAQRDVIELRYLHRLSVRETAERLGVPEGTVKARASRGCKQLREWLLAQEEGGEGGDSRGGRVPRPRP